MSEEMSISLVYIAVPEKYLTPGSLCSVQLISLSSEILSGAPHFGGKRSSHGPATSIDEATSFTCTRFVLPSARFTSYAPARQASNSTWPSNDARSSYAGGAYPPPTATNSNFSFSLIV